jgi:hypothetical protein
VVGKPAESTSQEDFPRDAMLLQKLSGEDSYQWSSREEERPAEVQIYKQEQMTNEEAVKVTYSEHFSLLH